MQTNEGYFHVYNRGAHRAPIFSDGDDYYRFLELLYIANNKKLLVFKALRQDVYSIKRDEILIDIFAYCLMPNHFHIGIVGDRKNVSRFIRKLCISYSMYYNKKYNHSGTLFQGKYKAKVIDSDQYFYRVIEYIHLNPFGIEEPDMMKEAKVEHYDEAVTYSKKYEFSSYKDYLGEKRKQGVILTPRSDLGIPRSDLGKTTSSPLLLPR